jgi:hypothetical protein
MVEAGEIMMFGLDDFVSNSLFHPTPVRRNTDCDEPNGLSDKKWKKRKTRLKTTKKNRRRNR